LKLETSGAVTYFIPVKDHYSPQKR